MPLRGLRAPENEQLESASVEASGALLNFPPQAAAWTPRPMRHVATEPCAELVQPLVPPTELVVSCVPLLPQLHKARDCCCVRHGTVLLHLLLRDWCSSLSPIDAEGGSNETATALLKHAVTGSHAGEAHHREMASVH